MAVANVSALPVVAIVGDDLRNRWFAAELKRDPRFEVRAVLVERHIPPMRGETDDEDALIADHFSRRNDAERRFFGSTPMWDGLGAPVRIVDRGGPNEDDHALWVRSFEPVFLVLYGCGIVKAPLLEEWVGRTVNMHLGLSPYYRGNATNFWPLVNGEPECVGATIHLATLSVDAGPILRQVRPPMDPDDGSHDIGCRAVVAGAHALKDALVAFAAGRLKPIRQRGGGRLYLNADFSARAVEEMRRRFADGMIQAYLTEKPVRDAQFPIVE